MISWMSGILTSSDLQLSVDRVTRFSKRNLSTPRRMSSLSSSSVMLEPISSRIREVMRSSKEAWVASDCVSVVAI